MTYEKMDALNFLPGSAGLAGISSKSAPVLDQARAILRQANDVSNRILVLADKLCGPVPEQCSSGGYASEPTPMGELERFRAEMRDTRQAMIFADDALTRIEQELIG